MDNDRKFSAIDRLLKKTINRRNFIKTGAAGFAGSMLAANLLSFLINVDPASADQKATAWVNASGAVIHTPSRCTGCRLCETTCTMTNDGKAHPHTGRIKIGRNQNYGPQAPRINFRSGDGQFGNLRLIGEVCRQCEDPFCGNACPAGAISADQTTGARVVDGKVCIGCGTCREACPWSMPTLDPETGKSTKCTLCHGAPQCARICPNGATRFLTWKEAVKLYQRHAESHIKR